MSYYDSDAWRTSRGMPAGARIDGGVRPLCSASIATWLAPRTDRHRRLRRRLWLLPKHREHSADLGCHAGATRLRLALSFGIQRMSAAMATALFWLYAAVMGLSLGGIFLVFTGASIARVFFIMAAI